MSILSKFKLHPLQIKRIEAEAWYREQREKLESDYKEQLKNIQYECTHHYEDDKTAMDWGSPPFSETYCKICNK